MKFIKIKSRKLEFNYVLNRFILFLTFGHYYVRGWSENSGKNETE